METLVGEGQRVARSEPFLNSSFFTLAYEKVQTHVLNNHVLFSHHKPSHHTLCAACFCKPDCSMHARSERVDTGEFFRPRYTQVFTYCHGKTHFPLSHVAPHLALSLSLNLSSSKLYDPRIRPLVTRHIHTRYSPSGAIDRVGSKRGSC